MNRPLSVLLLVAASLAGASAFGGPSQADTDAQYWSRLPNGGVAARPYVSDLSVTTNGVTYTAWSGLTSPSASPPSALTGSNGRLTATIYAVNMCQVNQTSGCYNEPNRVAVDIGVSDMAATSYSFDSKPCTDQEINSTSLFDITIQLNTFATSTVSWTVLNGKIEYWSLANGVMRIKMRPALAPIIDWSSAGNNGCTATPIRDCNVNSTSGSTLSAYLTFSVDHTLRAVTGVAFATEGAIIGYLNPVFSNGATTNPELQYQLSSAHYQPNGQLQLGSMRAILPLTLVTSLFPGYTGGGQSAFNLQRIGAGTQDAITWSNWTAAAHGTESLVFDVTGVTFSAPTYALSFKSGAAGLQASATLIMALVMALLALMF